jgi:hypothetical protein
VTDSRGSAGQLTRCIVLDPDGDDVEAVFSGGD